MTISIGQVYRHYKGEIYIVSGLATSANNDTDGETSVSYYPLNGDSTIYHRSEKEFNETVTSGEFPVPRFKLLPSVTRFFQRTKAVPGNGHLFPVYTLQDLQDFINGLKEVGLNIEQGEESRLKKTYEVINRHNALGFSVQVEKPCVILTIGNEYNIIAADEVTRLARQIETDKHFKINPLAMTNRFN